MEKDSEMIIRSICQDLYENLRHNSSAFSKIKSRRYLSKLKSYNKKTDGEHAEDIRDNIGILYKNYMVFSKKEEYENNADIILKIIKIYTELCNSIEQSKLGNVEKVALSKRKKIEKYITELEATYGGQTEKYIKKLTKKHCIGKQRKAIVALYKDKSKITATKKKEVLSILRGKVHKEEAVQDVKIMYNCLKAEYVFIRKEQDKIVEKKKYRFNQNFSDIEKLQRKALNNFRQLNFSIDPVQEIKADKNCLKYLDPFILNIFVQEEYLDYAKIYLKKINGNIDLRKEKLPFKIVYQIDENIKHGALTPTRNRIINILAQRAGLSIAEVRRVKTKSVKVPLKELKIG